MGRCIPLQQLWVRSRRCATVSLQPVALLCGFDEEVNVLNPGKATALGPQRQSSHFVSAEQEARIVSVGLL
jgi:hypothetical protein